MNTIGGTTSTTQNPPVNNMFNANRTANYLTLDNPVFCCYLFWASALVAKMLLMSMLTALQRFRNKVFPNEEDLFFKNIEVQFNDKHVERVRRAHRNDMENVLPYFIMALLYITTNPDVTMACWLFRIASVARILHTLVYAFYPVPQPSRIIAFVIMFVITWYMAAAVALQVMKDI